MEKSPIAVQSAIAGRNWPGRDRGFTCAAALSLFAIVGNDRWTPVRGGEKEESFAIGDQSEKTTPDAANNLVWIGRLENN